MTSSYRLKSLLPPYFLALAIICSGCGPVKEKADNTQLAEKEASSEVLLEEREPTDDEVREYGILTAIEDSGYPLFSIDVEFPEREMTASFSFNIEKSPLSMEQLIAMKGKYATFYYTTEDALQLADIIHNGKTVLGEYGLDSFEGFDSATGKLSGAEAPTSGDLPGTITLTSGNNTLEFDYFITDEVVAINEKEVTVYYYELGVNEITYIWASED